MWWQHLAVEVPAPEDLAAVLRTLLAVIKEAPDFVGLQKHLSKVLTEVLVDASARAPELSSSDEGLVQQDVWARKLPGRLCGRGLPFLVSCLMQQYLTVPPACLLQGMPRAGLGYADQRRAWSAVLRKCGENQEDVAAVHQWVVAEKAARRDGPASEAELPAPKAESSCG